MTGRLWLALAVLGAEVLALGWIAWQIRVVGRAQR